MTARDLDELLQEQTAYERKCQIISEIAAYIDGMSNQAAYREQIDLLFAALEKSARDLESGGGLDDVCAKEIVGRVSDLKERAGKISGMASGGGGGLCAGGKTAGCQSGSSAWHRKTDFGRAEGK